MSEKEEHCQVHDHSLTARVTVLPTISSRTNCWQKLKMGIGVLEFKSSVLHGSKINHTLSLAEAGLATPQDDKKQLQDENMRRFCTSFWIKTYYTICDLWCFFLKSFWWLWRAHNDISSPWLFSCLTLTYSHVCCTRTSAANTGRALDSWKNLKW